MFPGLSRHFQKGRGRGGRGELRVAKVLDELRKFGYRIFYDLRREGDNIDHVIVGPAGVFAIATNSPGERGEIESPESENTSRALGLTQSLEPAETAGGEELFIGRFPEEKVCLKQAPENGAEANGIIKENCEFDGWVWPLVVFAGKLPVRNDQTTDARLFTAETLMNHIVNQQPRLTPSEIDSIASHLERER